MSDGLFRSGVAGPRAATPAEAAEPLDRCVPGDCGETIATLLHDLNQPLTALTNYLAAAQIAVEHNAMPETIGGLVQDASAQGARARAIVRQLRDHLAR